MRGDSTSAESALAWDARAQDAADFLIYGKTTLAAAAYGIFLQAIGKTMLFLSKQPGERRCTSES
jgi:hypothetical protein